VSCNLCRVQAQDLGVDPSNPQENIRGGIQYLKNLSAQFNNDPTRALAAYNAGPNSKFFQTGDVKDLPDETVKYVKRIAGYNDVRWFIAASFGSLIRRIPSNNRRLNLPPKRLHHLKSKSQE
jgi:membrane-bound lytic murein transglycosylase MltF